LRLKHIELVIAGCCHLCFLFDRVVRRRGHSEG
jgi:hypothetical protein